VDVVRDVKEFIKGKGKASRKALVAPPAQLGRPVGMEKQEKEWALCFKAF
jgi:hypothetical protein